MDASSASHEITILAVGDLAASVAFYREVFGWPVRVEADVYVELALPGGGGVGLYEKRAFARNTFVVPTLPEHGQISGTELYLRCADLDGVIERLRAAGARQLSPRQRRDWGDEVAYFADPAGNVLAVARRIVAG
jgi:predicted enzyme related to lactoylglutathione lyase